MISEWSFSFRLKQNQNEYQRIELFSTSRKEGNKIFVIPSNQQSTEHPSNQLHQNEQINQIDEEVVFEMTRPDIQSQTFFIDLISSPSLKLKKKNTRLSIEKKYPHRLVIGENEKENYRWKFSDGKLYCYPEKEINGFLKVNEDPFGVVEIMTMNKMNYFYVNCGLTFERVCEKGEFVHSAEYLNIPTSYLTLINEIPNRDVIPGTPYFQTILHNKKHRKGILKFERNKEGETILQLVNCSDSTARLIFGKWFLGIVQNRVVWCDEKEAVIIKQDIY